MNTYTQKGKFYGETEGKKIGPFNSLEELNEASKPAKSTIKAKRKKKEAQ